MSIAALMQRLAEVPPVPPSGNREGTDKSLTNQCGSPGSPGSLAKTKEVGKNGISSPSSDFQRRREVEPGPAYRRWQVTDPGGKCWSVTCCPPTTVAELAATWPAGTALEPVPDAPTQPACPPLPAAQDGKIRAWLDSIGEADLSTIREVLVLCADDPAILAFYLDQAAQVPDPSHGGKSCGTCARYRRTSHPHLGHCQGGEPEPAGGLWDTDLRSCEQWEGANQ